MIIAVDPGPEQSAVVVYVKGEIEIARIVTNEQCLGWMSIKTPQHLAIEGVQCFGMPIGKETIDTCIWIGRFIQEWKRPHTVVYRKDIKLHLCQSARATDSNIRQALIDRFGGSKAKAIGKKAAQGPLYGITSHLWSALAVAITYEETK